MVDKILELIYPSNIKCIICNRPIKKDNTYSLCKDCFNELNFINNSCIKCGRPILNSIIDEVSAEESLHGCSNCIGKSYYFDKAISCIEYDLTSKVMVLDFKYYRKTFMSKYIVEIMKEKLDIEGIEYDYILYVPLHKKRESKRGFNQSKVIANYLGKELGVEVLDCIERHKNTLRLFKLDSIERKKELKNAFNINNRVSKCKNKKVLLIDDIFTTGSTVNEIAKMLKVNNVQAVYVLTFLTRINCY